jgi:lysophospholipase L1-like esterase
MNSDQKTALSHPWDQSSTTASGHTSHPGRAASLSPKKRLLAIVIATTVGLILAELACRAYEAAQRARESYVARHTADARRAAIRLTKTESLDLKWHFVPHLHHAYAPSQRTSSVIIGREGWRGGDVPPKRPGEYRIVLLGGSLAWSYGASSEEHTISRLLQKRLRSSNPKCVVLNAAHPGFVTSQELTHLQQSVLRHKPDMVIDLTGFNDVYAALLGQQPGEPFKASADRDIAEHPIRHGLVELCRYSALWRRIEKNLERRPFSLKGRPHPEKVAEVFLENVRSMAAICNARSIDYLPILQPILHPATKPQLSATEEDVLVRQNRRFPDYEAFLVQCYRGLGDALASLPGESANYADLFRDRKEEVFFDLCHITDAHNDLVARRLAQDLAVNGLLVQEHQDALRSSDKTGVLYNAFGRRCGSRLSFCRGLVFFARTFSSNSSAISRWKPIEP